ncbi:hypothetical protein WIS52_01500 [Pseudonocardia nematodicida]|uniref:Uncharacterized protein n=1 Tax=Pseudonocardia nematodicida TaxID=1206997 RepID=A0ABV1K3U7_9PSEU
MTVVETILVFVVAPVVLYAAIWAWIALRNRSGRTRYNAGDPWPYAPLFWIANPAGAHLQERTASPSDADSDTRGGTGGRW